MTKGINMKHTYDIDLTVAYLPDWFDPHGVMDEDAVDALVDQWVTRAIELLEERGDTVAYFGDGYEDRAWENGQKIEMPVWAESILDAVNEEFDNGEWIKRYMGVKGISNEH